MKVVRAAWRCAALLLIAGCSSRQAQLAVSDAPPVSAEYSRLDMLVGSWRATSRAEFVNGDQVVVTHAVVEADWGLGGRFVVARSKFSFTDTASEAPQSSSESVSWFTWDQAAGKYVYWNFRSDGTVSTGSMDFDAASNTWSMEETAVDPATGKRVVTGWGTMEYLCDSEKRVRWHSRPLTGAEFESAGQSRKVRSR